MFKSNHGFKMKKLEAVLRIEKSSNELKNKEFESDYSAINHIGYIFKTKASYSRFIEIKYL